MLVEQTHHYVIVGGNLIVERVVAVLLINFPLYIERRMGWHETESQPERAEHLRRVVAHYLVGVVVAYKKNVAIYGIDGFIGAEGMRHVLQHIIGSEIVVGIEYSHHISVQRLIPLFMAS